jgi:serine protease Do
MSIYKLPEIHIKKLKTPSFKRLMPGKKMPFPGLFLLLVFLIGLAGGLLSSYVFYLKLKQEIAAAGVPIIHSEKVIEKDYVPQTTQEEKVIDVVKDNSPSVVSVVISKQVPVYETQYYYPLGEDNSTFVIPQLKQTGTKEEEVGAGSGFIVSADGLILTNKHVVSDDKASYTVVMSDGTKHPAAVLAKDPVQDIAIIKIEAGNQLVPLKLGESDDVQAGQSVIAIGNALGEFENTVSVGVVSGLARTVVASGETLGTELLEDIIQTDAAINQGNSGGPLLNLKGEVIGINTAVAQSGQNVGFTIAIDKAKRDIEQVKATGKISYPFLGVRYLLIDSDVAKDKNLSVDYGVLVAKGKSADEPAVTSGSPAEKAGLKEGDIILTIDGKKIDKDNSLTKLISPHNPGDAITLHILRNGKEMDIPVVLGEWKQ